MPRPTRCACPDCTPSLPSLARTGAEEFVDATMRALDSLRDLAAGEDTRDAYTEAQRAAWRVDYTTPGYQPPEAA